MPPLKPKTRISKIINEIKKNKKTIATTISMSGVIVKLSMKLKKNQEKIKKLEAEGVNIAVKLREANSKLIKSKSKIRVLENQLNNKMKEIEKETRITQELMNQIALKVSMNK